MAMPVVVLEEVKLKLEIKLTFLVNNNTACKRLMQLKGDVLAKEKKIKKIKGDVAQKSNII